MGMLYLTRFSRKWGWLSHIHPVLYDDRRYGSAYEIHASILVQMHQAMIRSDL